MRVVRSWWNYWKWRFAWDTVTDCHYSNTSQFTAQSLPSAPEITLHHYSPLRVTPGSWRMCVTQGSAHSHPDWRTRTLPAWHWLPGRVTQPLVSIMILYLQMSLTQNFRAWWGSEADNRGLLWGMRTFDTELGQESFSNKEDFIIVLSNYDILLGELSLSGPAPGSSVPEREDFNSKIMGKQAAEEC